MQRNAAIQPYPEPGLGELETMVYGNPSVLHLRALAGGGMQARR
jgi:hypothetical protein